MWYRRRLFKGEIAEISPYRDITPMEIEINKGSDLSYSSLKDSAHKWESSSAEKGQILALLVTTAIVLAILQF